MEEELNKFERNQVWELVPRPSGKHIIGAIWVFKNNLDENGIIVRNMDNCKEMGTPMGSRTYVDQDESGVSIHIIKYQGMIASLLYLTASRPDIMFSVCLCAWSQANLKYLTGTTNIGLWYPKGSICELLGYTDSNYAGYKIDLKSTSRTCHILGNALVSWSFKKQACVALSTAEAEYIVAGSCCTQILWLKQRLSDYGLNLGCILLK
ncbi:secreted RxLR effector protein 161-like [Lathyrus oleraceus]|uniref:secreted RxLR effector protein 161-like n=1 Tax=Pisum sativum TaxID=3888 RepID=UPI0021CEE442|nr:secreted RxLR effector protein 161-like [Pisum sativum]